MKLESLNSDDLKKRSSSRGGLFFGFPLHSIWKKTNKTIHKNEFGELAYEQVGKTLVVAGDPAGNCLDDQVRCFNYFLNWARDQGFTVCGYYFSEQFSLTVPMRKHLTGVSLLQNLTSWHLGGGASEEARRALRKGKSQQLQIIELDDSDMSHWKEKLLNFSQNWRASKGYLQIRFLLTPLSLSLSSLGNEERLFVCVKNYSIEAVVTLRNWGPGRWYVDQLMQKPEGFRFSLDYLLVQVMQKLKQEGAETLSLGFCPGIIASAQTWVEKTLKVWGGMKVFYSPKGLYNFKKKYSSDQVNRYLLLDPQGSASKQLLQMERVTLGFKPKF